jgi:hypothetical protein
LKSCFWSSVCVSGQLINRPKEPHIFQLLILIREVVGVVGRELKVVRVDGIAPKETLREGEVSGEELYKMV